MCTPDKRILKKRKKLLKNSLSGKNLPGNCKSASSHIVDIINDRKGSRVNRVDHLFHIIDFPVRQDGKNNLGRVQMVSAFCLQKRKSQVERMEKFLTDLFVLGGKDQKLDFGAAVGNDLVDHDAGDKDDNNSVYSLQKRL